MAGRLNWQHIEPAHLPPYNPGFNPARCSDRDAEYPALSPAAFSFA
jgi:hypothetical protein